MEHRSSPQTHKPRFFSVLAEHLWDLLGLNLLCFFCFLPTLAGVGMLFSGMPYLQAGAIITLGALTSAPACRGMARTVRDLAEGRCYEPFRGFAAAWREEYLRSVLLGVPGQLTAAALLCLLVNALRRPGSLSAVWLWLSAVGLLGLALVFFYAWLMLANVQLPTGVILRNAILLVFGCPRRTLTAAAALLGLLLLCGCVLPYTLTLLPVCLFSGCWLCCGWPMWQAVCGTVLPSAAAPATDGQPPAN